MLGAVDEVMPNSVRDVSTRMRQLFDDSGFPAILDPLTPTPDVQVSAPDPTLAATPALRKSGLSVLKVRGIAPSCSRQIEGSGFVIGPGKLITNAHVVAGTSRLTVQQGDSSLPATVVVYDPNRDLAVLDVPGLTRPALEFAGKSAKEGQSVAAAGYPLDGPFTISPGRIRSEITLNGPNIYSSTTVTRDVYTLRANVRAGNSGGPLLDDRRQGARSDLRRGDRQAGHRVRPHRGRGRTGRRRRSGRQHPRRNRSLHGRLTRDRSPRRRMADCDLIPVGGCRDTLVRPTGELYRSRGRRNVTMALLTCSGASSAG